MSLPRGSTRRPVAVAMLFLAVVLLGLISFLRLPIDLLPDVSYPRLVVYTAYPDVAPAEVERVVTERVEARAAAVPGVQRVTSISREGVSLVTLRFAWGTDMDFAMLGVREELDELGDVLPESATRPRILRVDPESEPVLGISVAGGADLWRTKEIAETVFRRRLEQLDGVAEAATTGGLDREIHVEVDPERLDAYGIEIEEVVRALDAANYSAPGGTILRGRYRYPLRTLGEFQEVAEIQDVVVARQQIGPTDGEQDVRLVRLADVGRVVDGFAEREAMARYDGAESVGILVFKESGANTVQVAREVDRVIGELGQQFPDFRLDVAFSQAGFIADSISNVVSALVLGGLLAFLVLFFFLRDPRYPVGVALAIPISVVGTFALMDAFGVSLNIMSLGGLALGVGMLVDNSIVVLENIFRHREEGKSALEAAALGAEEVQGAITASTLTTISVFGPIIYVQGVAGELFSDLSLSVAFSLLASLLVALTLLPALAARFAGGAGTEDADAPEAPDATPASGRWARVRWIGRGALLAPLRAVVATLSVAAQLVGYWLDLLRSLVAPLVRPLLAAFDVGFTRFQGRYHRTLDWALDHRGRVLAASAGALALTVLIGWFLPRDLLPDVDQGAFDVRLTLEEGTSLDATASEARRLEEVIRADPDVEAVFGRIGRDVRSYAESEETTGLHTAGFQVRLVDGAATDDVVTRIRREVTGLPPGAVAFETGQATAMGRMLGGAEADVAVRIRGDDLDQAFIHATRVRDRLAEVPSLTNVRIGQDQGRPQVQVEIVRDAAARYGIEPRLVAETIEDAMRGALATEFVDFDRKIGVVVRLPDEQRFDRATLDRLRIQGVPLPELIRVEEALGPTEVRREDQGRLIQVYADVADGGLDAAIVDIEAALAGVPAPRGLRVDVGGENEEMRRSFRALAFAFALAMLLVYMVLAAQFESFSHPFTILVAVPLAVVGAVAALTLTGGGLNTMSLIGVVILIGIVVNDAIVKVDFINQMRASGMTTRTAILEAGRVRLRPILMTTITTILGLTPMALGVGRGADLRAPLAISVIGGLALATLLTLVVVPVVYAVIEDLKGAWADAPDRALSSPEPLEVAG